MSVFSSGFGKRMTKQLADGRKRDIVHDGGRREAVAQIMDAHIGQRTTPPEREPPVADDDRLVAAPVREH